MYVFKTAAYSLMLMLLACHDLDAVPRIDASGIPDVGADVSELPDVGVDVSDFDSGFECTPRPPPALPSTPAPHCSQRTLDRVLACRGDKICIRNSLAIDTTQAMGGLNCNACYSLQIGACTYNDTVCGDAYNAVDCCSQENECTAADACLECGDAAAEVLNCFNVVTCATDLMQCFPSP